MEDKNQTYDGRKTAFTADFHWGHKNILHLCNRPFSSIDENDRTIVTNYNSVVEDDWTVWIAGDLGYKCSSDYVSSHLRKLKGNIKVILGNHDKPLRSAVDRGLLDDMIHSGRLEIIGSTDPSIVTAKQIVLDGQRVIVSHYPYRSWPGSFRGCIQAYGHCHGNCKLPFKAFDIGVDNNLFYPIIGSDLLSRAAAVQTEFHEK